MTTNEQIDLDHGWRVWTSRSRLMVMLAVGVIVAVVTGLTGSWSLAPLAGWSAAAIIFTGWVWLAVGRLDAADTASHATREDPSRGATDILIIVASVASLGAVGLVLVEVKSASGLAAGVLTGSAIIGVSLSWVLIHTLFMLKYARLYYTGPDGGIDFNSDDPPRYTDFAYLAFTLGMTFQVSDTDIKTHPIRATVLRHSLLSYLFGAVILATIINLVAGLSNSK